MSDRVLRSSLTASFLVLAACGSTPSTPDATRADAGNDGSTTVDAASLPDTGTLTCNDGYAGCTTASATDDTSMTSVTIGVVGDGTTSNYMYSATCIRIHTGTTVTLPNSTLHPLAAASCSPTDSPLISTPAATTFTFNHAGRYGYFCENHGADGGSGMAGLIIVE